MDRVDPGRPDFCPYIGLQPYNEEYQDYFFGRERDSRVISSNLYAAPLTVLYGASGVGKSSVLRAGVIPRLQASAQTAVVLFDEWADKAPLETLKAKCLEIISTSMAGIQLDTSQPLDEFLFSATQASGRTLMIILDQFEEFFLYHRESEREQSFDAEFARAVNREEVDVNFLISLREDALSRLDRFRARIPNMLSNALRLRHLDAASARDAILKPLEVYNSQFPNDPAVSVEGALVEELIREIRVEKLVIGPIGRGGLEVEESPDESSVRIEAPFLQLVLTRLWEEEIQRRGASELRLSALHDLGGAGHIIRTHMDEAMNNLSAEEQETAGSIFRYMVTPSGSKIAYTVADLEYYARPESPLQPVLEKLCRRDVRIMRTLSLPGEPENTRYEIYHDVLAPAVLDWRTRFDQGKQLLSLFYLLIEKGDTDRALQVYQEMVQKTPQQAFFPEHHQIQKIWGEGELGISYLIRDQKQDRLLTATILKDAYADRQETITQFAAQMEALSSPRISRFLGVGRHHDHTYFLSEYVDARSLRESLKGQPLPYKQAMQIARQVAEGLEDGHRQGIPHLHLRPSNILMGAGGVKLVSYGYSRLTDPASGSETLDHDHSYDYQAPEQLAGEAGDERSDIYALGTILYEMLTGHPPGLGSYQYPSETNVEVTEAVDVLIDHARERNPERRFSSAGELRIEIDRISRVSLERGANQVVRIAVAWVSDFYQQLTSRKWLGFLFPGLFILLAVSVLSMPPLLSGLARVAVPLLLNSILVSILFDWVIRAIARRRGLGSLLTTSTGMGAVLGLVFSINLIRVVGFWELAVAPEILSIFAGMLTVVLFETALSIGIILLSARLMDRLLKSYTIGFYWSFIAILLVELILTVIRQPVGMFIQ